MTSEEYARKVARLNDHFRKTGEGGQCYITAGVNALGVDTIEKVADAVRNFNEFSRDNDPHQEHDFGKITVDGIIFFWKIDYYDNSLKFLSPDASDPDVTKRVMTIMKIDEY